MNYKDTIELRVGFEVVEPNKWMFSTGPDSHILKYEIEGFSTIYPFECTDNHGDLCICELRTTDKRFSAKVAFLIEAGKTEDDSKVKELIKDHLPIARKALSKKIRLHLLEKISTGEGPEITEDLKEKIDEFRSQNIV